jgi:hypothetical protein
MTRELLSSSMTQASAKPGACLATGMNSWRTRAQSRRDVGFSHWYQHRSPLERLSAAARPRGLSSRAPGDDEPPLFVQKAQSA